MGAEINLYDFEDLHVFNKAPLSRQFGVLFLKHLLYHHFDTYCSQLSITRSDQLRSTEYSICLTYSTPSRHVLFPTRFHTASWHMARKSLKKTVQTWPQKRVGGAMENAWVPNMKLTYRVNVKSKCGKTKNCLDGFIHKDSSFSWSVSDMRVNRNAVCYKMSLENFRELSKYNRKGKKPTKVSTSHSWTPWKTKQRGSHRRAACSSVFQVSPGDGGSHIRSFLIREGGAGALAYTVHHILQLLSKARQIRSLLFSVFWCRQPQQDSSSFNVALSKEKQVLWARALRMEACAKTVKKKKKA